MGPVGDQGATPLTTSFGDSLVQVYDTCNSFKDCWEARKPSMPGYGIGKYNGI